jgi:hypothetical protein
MATLPASGVLVADKIVPRSQGCKAPYVVEREFDLSSLLSAPLANADTVNLFARPANVLMLGASLEVVAAGSKNASATAFTCQLRDGTTALGAALDMTTAGGIAIGGNGTYNMPLALTTAANVNLLVAVAGTGGLVTANPTVRVKFILCEMAA